MWVARLSSFAAVIFLALPLWPAAAEPALPDVPPAQAEAIAEAPLVELIATAATNVVEATAPFGESDAVDETELPASEDELAEGDRLSDRTDALPLMRPIAVSEDVDAPQPGSQRLAALHLPEAEPLGASAVEPAALKQLPLKEKALQAKLVSEPLKETVLREAIAASLQHELIEPLEMDSTDISGQVLIDPLTVVISLKDQRLDVYRGFNRVETTRVSSGKRGYQTLTGVFGILEKKQEHYSNLYDNAPMPWMQRLTRSGTAIHAGHVPNYPASHGCVRMPYKFAPKLFRMTNVGGKVAMMTGPMVEPRRIESPTLVMPASSADASVEASVEAGLRAGALAAVLSPGTELADAKDDTKAKNTAPWHILVTRREERDIAIGTQEALAAMGYLEPLDEFVGYLGSGTRKAIRAFEKDHGLRQRGVFNEAIAAKIYEAAGKGALPDAYLFLRRGFSRVAHAPVQLRDAKKPLGTHLFTFVHPSDGSEAGWTGISLEGEDSGDVLDRIAIPEDMRRQISQGLTSGASFIVADVAKHSSVLPEGDDFIVRTNDSAASNVVAEKAKAERRKQAARSRAVAPQERVLRVSPQRKRTVTRHKSTVRRSVSAPRGFRLFGRR